MRRLTSSIRMGTIRHASYTTHVHESYRMRQSRDLTAFDIIIALRHCYVITLRNNYTHKTIIKHVSLGNLYKARI